MFFHLFIRSPNPTYNAYSLEELTNQAIQNIAHYATCTIDRATKGMCCSDKPAIFILPSPTA